MDEKKPAASAAATHSKASAGRKATKNCENLSFAAKEAFKRLRTNLVMTFPEDETACRLIGITSAQPGDGKSTIALNLAYSLAELGKEVLLIDADMRRSTIHSKAGVAPSPGLSDLMNGASSISDSRRRYVSSTDEVFFDIIPGGKSPENPSELLNSARMSKLLEALSSVYDYILLDLPPIGTVIDAVSVSREVDGMIVVIRENTCPRGLLAECMSQLAIANVNVLGFVVNGAMEGSSKKYQYGNAYSHY